MLACVSEVVAEAQVVFMMGKHPRLGERSLVQAMPTETLRMIMDYLAP